jgi:hypothetical protein
MVAPTSRFGVWIQSLTSLVPLEETGNFARVSCD